MNPMQSKKEEYIRTECYFCLQPVDLSLKAKCFVCPHCGEHQQFDAAEMYERLKMIMKQVYGEKPAKPQNN